MGEARSVDELAEVGPERLHPSYVADLGDLLRSTVVGVDGCREGWVAVALRPGGAPGAYYLPRISALEVVVPDAALVGVDMPIGLPEAGRRRSDLAVRSLLGVRRSSLFFTPVREALAAPTYPDANGVSLRLTGSGISRQSYALRAKIFEVEEWVGSAPCAVREVHPETSFALLLGHPAVATKKSWAGMVERRAALEQVGIDLGAVSGPATVAAAVDDMLDAAVAAWSAARIAAGVARCFPDPPELTSAGLPMAIWA
jgi:predicted RNase H-like nuclease